MEYLPLLFFLLYTLVSEFSSCQIFGPHKYKDGHRYSEDLLDEYQAARPNGQPLAVAESNRKIGSQGTDWAHPLDRRRREG